MKQVKLLDCTLRDGGFINDWKFEKEHIINIFERLVSAELEMVEVGLLDQRRITDFNRTIQPNTENYEKIFQGIDKKNTMVVAMIDYGTCDIENITKSEHSFLDGIRVIFKKKDRDGALAFCNEIKKIGYKVFVQAVSITSYSDEELKELIEMVNELEPYAFSLVDTYGLLHKSQLIHYYKFANEHLKENISLGYHAHNNFQLAYANCIELIENHEGSRTLLIDGSLYGMGKSAGNAPTELVAGYMIERLHKTYNQSQILEAIDLSILDIYEKIPWGYCFKFYIAAAHDCHPSYVTYLMDKRKLSVKSIHLILKTVEKNKRLTYDQDYIETLYIQHQAMECDDLQDRKRLKEKLENRTILLIGPGENIEIEEKKVHDFITEKNPTIISINYIPEKFEIEYLFMSNAKRYVQQSSKISMEHKFQTIATSNVTKTSGMFDFILNYSSLLDEEALMHDNPMIMFIKLLAEFQVKEIALAGFDGYTKTKVSNYINPNMEYSFSKEKAEEINRDVSSSLERIENKPYLVYVTKTKYTE